MSPGKPEQRTGSLQEGGAPQGVAPRRGVAPGRFRDERLPVSLIGFLRIESVPDSVVFVSQGRSVRVRAFDRAGRSAPVAAFTAFATAGLSPARAASGVRRTSPIMPSRPAGAASRGAPTCERAEYPGHWPVPENTGIGPFFPNSLERLSRRTRHEPDPIKDDHFTFCLAGPRDADGESGARRAQRQPQPLQHRQLHRVRRFPAHTAGGREHCVLRSVLLLQPGGDAAERLGPIP